MWWKTGVIYQIYPRSFKDTNRDGIGDLKGIIEKLDYLNDGTPNSLGIDGIWISPFFVSPMKDFGYDISDYRDIDPLFGTLDDFKLLLAEAHKRGIHVIIDLVLNHTSDEHPWFQESKKNKENDKADWYLWHPGIDKKPPNNWFAQFEVKNAWWYSKERQEFYLGTFTRNQPELNWRNPDLRKEMFDLVRYWLDMGVDGFRLDVINWFIKDEEFRSNPYVLKGPDFQKHIYDRNRPETIEICQELRKITDSYEERMLVGEVYADNPDIASSYYGEKNDGLHMAFNFNFLFQPFKAPDIYKSILSWYESLKGEAWPNFTFSNHDNLRHYLRFEQKDWSDARAKVAATLLMTLRGTPFIYYGEELGMTGGTLRRKDLQDPLSKKTWPLKHFRRDLARTPMQWDGSSYSGFAEVAPWLPVDKDYVVNNVKIQEFEGTSLLNYYKKLIWLRKSNAALQIGTIRFYEEYLPDLLVYKRELESQIILVILSFSEKPISFETNNKLLSILIENKATLILSSSRRTDNKLDFENGISVNPYEALVISFKTLNK